MLRESQTARESKQSLSLSDIYKSIHTYIYTYAKVGLLARVQRPRRFLIFVDTLSDTGMSLYLCATH